MLPWQPDRQTSRLRQGRNGTNEGASSRRRAARDPRSLRRQPKAARGKRTCNSTWIPAARATTRYTEISENRKQEALLTYDGLLVFQEEEEEDEKEEGWTVRTD